jgi:hypothetical protein
MEQLDPFGQQGQLIIRRIPGDFPLFQKPFELMVQAGVKDQRAIEGPGGYRGGDVVQGPPQTTGNQDGIGPFMGLQKAFPDFFSLVGDKEDPGYLEPVGTEPPGGISCVPVQDPPGGQFIPDTDDFDL